MPSPIETLRDVYRHRDRAALAWKARGGRVVGYLCDNVPEELILAAGFLPYRLSADPHVGTEALERHVQPFAAPFSARNRGVGFTDAMLNMLLDGHYAFLDFLIVPHTRKSIQAFYRELSLARTATPELRLPECAFLDRAYTPFYASEVFNRQCVLELKATLETWCGQPITDAALAEAIRITNANRDLLQQVARRRTQDPPTLSGVDALQVIGTAAFMHKGEHSELLQGVLDDLDRAPRVHTGPRVFVGGSPLDHLQVYELVESCGAVVVAEDHCWGGRCGEFPVDQSPSPLEALADRYHRKPACSIEFPMSGPLERCVARATSARVDGAIFYVFEGDGVHVWDTPDEMRSLEHAGVPCLYLKRQPYWLEDPAPTRSAIEDFVASLRPATATVATRA